jgi:hypothetical protein
MAAIESTPLSPRHPQPRQRLRRFASCANLDDPPLPPIGDAPHVIAKLGDFPTDGAQLAVQIVIRTMF